MVFSGSRGSRGLNHQRLKYNLTKRTCLNTSLTKRQHADINTIGWLKINADIKYNMNSINQ